jgi:hypothetical protein
MQQTRSLYRAISVLALALLMMGAFQACADGDDDPSSTTMPVPIPTVCTNVGGMWDAVEDVHVTCTLAGQPSETDTLHGAGRVSITQNGCALSYVVPNSSITRTGVIDGQHVRFSGPFALALSGDVQFSRNSVSIEGDLQGSRMVLQGSGMAEGTAQGSSFVCTGKSTATFTRVSTPGVAARSQEAQREEPSLIFLDGAVHLLTIITQ